MRLSVIRDLWSVYTDYCSLITEYPLSILHCFYRCTLDLDLWIVFLITSHGFTSEFWILDSWLSLWPLSLGLWAVLTITNHESLPFLNSQSAIRFGSFVERWRLNQSLSPPSPLFLLNRRVLQELKSRSITPAELLGFVIWSMEFQSFSCSRFIRLR